MPRGYAARTPLMRFIRPHATYVYRGERSIAEYAPSGQLRRHIYGDEFGAMTLETMAMWLDDWEVRT